ncbi:hypothetical protein [Halomonas sp. GT]|uniref:hypothetical protein n=1 Tax=Halomonas sp. GT TaxID=1971364 RepID=UPI0009F182D8|nr:hypothetical protein [Halomonas sp. GT]
MPVFTVTDFSYIATSDAKLKQGRERSLKNRPSYAHYRDYYLSLRQAIKGLFKHQRSFDHLHDVAKKSHKDKQDNYSKIAENFISWAKGKNIYHYDPPKASYQYRDTEVLCNPELYYKVDGEDRLLKLHFNSSKKMNQQRANIICFLISESCDVPLSECRVLDLSMRKIYSFKGSPDTQLEMVESEIRRIESEWDEL